ncbi:L-aspartate oxidase [Bradyrhizobium sp. SSBR45G]|uniref:L-aspartate oxidase n=1 Tax=unclassified Bradyrhizobium TaxID=2631580 RepID=UPI00234293A0|nr:MULTISPECIES: L-aspartate oxidase [unclassified Bradyrhizobium]GLH80602.1 L-aspartate oxidase [Bradyrhizobium sp. SSBR45G]GLH85808.1 L-aspartate oxidase [Bradyrhizobium sp. SSBR45R]
MDHDQIETSGQVVIVGAGVAGLFCALKLAPRPVTLISATPLGEEAFGATMQADIAAAVAPGDSPESHAADMIAAGGGLVDEDAARALARDAAAAIEDLLRLGLAFDRDHKGALATSRAAAHSARRILSVRGDFTGQAIVAALVQAVRATPSIRLIEGHVADALLTGNGAVRGLQLRRTDDPAAAAVLLAAPAVVLATGGIGHLFAATTNPDHANGIGLAIAARAGAVIADPEFVQFHPTAMMTGHDPAPVVSESLRGLGAILINRRGQRFMLPRHPLVDLAPRDTVARGIMAEIMAGRGAFLDARDVLDEDVAERYPVLHRACVAAGLDPTRQPIPVAPAAHFHMGGIAVDARGRTSIEGLWAAGEVAATATDGANHIAGNALLAALVFAGRIAEDLSGRTFAGAPGLHDVAFAAPAGADATPSERTLREIMTSQVGVIREEERLAEAIVAIARMERDGGSPNVRNMASAALLIATAAWSRRESRGAHCRADCPAENPSFAQRTMTTLAAAREIADDLAARPTARQSRPLSA